MSIAQTAQLLVELNLAGNYNSGIAQAEGRTAAFGNTVAGGTAKAETFASRLSGGVGNALSTFKGRLESAAKSIALFAGVGGLLTLGGAIKSGIERAQALGDEVRRLAALTGEGATSMSVLAATLQHYGVNADTATRLTGFLEKNVGLLAAKKDGLVKFQQEFGLALTDSNGKIKDANALILTTVDYFNNKSIPATEKAAALSKIYGRSWQDLIPYLSAGRAGIAATTAEVIKLGGTLDQTQVNDLAKMKDATRLLGSAFDALTLQIGLALVPAITDMANGLSSFISDHRTEIVQFFKDAAKFAGEAGGTISRVAGAIGGFWNTLPKPFRDLLVTGLVADRTIKFLFGFDPLKLVVSGIEGALGKAVGNGLVSAGLGKLFVQPVFVTNMGVGGLGGGPGGAVGAAEGAAGAAGAAAGGIGLGTVGAAIAAFLAVPLAMTAAGVRVNPETRRGPGRGAAFGPGGSININDPVSPNRSVAPDDRPGLTAIKRSVDTENAAVTKAIHAQIAAVAAAEKASERNLQPLPAHIAAAQKASFNALRDRIEAARIALVSGTTKIATHVDTARINTIAAVRTGDSAVVAAIKASRPVISVVVNGRTVTTTYRTGLSVSRTASVGSYNAGLTQGSTG